jgi:hypothetical protein
MYMKHGRRQDIEVGFANNEVQFASQFFNFLRKHPELIISQMSVPQVNLEVGPTTPQVVPAPLPITKSTMCMTAMNPSLTHYSMSKAVR